MTEPSRPRALASASAVYEYTDAAGTVEFLVARWEPRGEEKKKFAQYSVQDGKWVAKAPAPTRQDGTSYQRPLYHLPALIASPEAPVLVVEGEKSFTAACQYLPPGWLATTWAGGVQATGKTDWKPLYGRRVAIWPDNDEGGFQAAAKLKAITGGSVVILPDGLPQKWDLADPLPPDLTADLISAMIIREPPKQQADSAKPERKETKSIRYLPLGSDGNRTFYFLTTHSGKVLDRSSGELRKYDGCMDLVTDLVYWAKRYSGSEGGINWKNAGDDLITESRQRGLFDGTLARGRGVWLDPLGTIMHTGNSVFIDSKESHPVDIKSRHFYPLKTRMFPDFTAPPLTDAEGVMIRDAFEMLRWDKKIYGLFLAGLVATAPICGALKWRTHGWITGPRGCGKTWILDDMVGKLLDHIALKVLGETTAPGIRSALDNDARPVIFDESEGETQAGQIRIDALIGLMRAASRQTDAKILKGSSNHKAVSFDIQAQFICGAINNGLKRAADTSRTLVLTLKSNDGDCEAVRKENMRHFNELKSAVAKFPSNISVRLMKRMANLVPVVRANADTFMRLIASKFADARTGDQIGTVLAGAWALTSSKILTDAEAMEKLQKIKWEQIAQGHGQDDGRTMINHLASYRMTIKNSSGIPHDRTIGEVMAIASGHVMDMNVGASIASDALKRCGIICEEKGFVVARRHPFLDKLFETSDYPGGYTTFFGRCPGARPTTPKRFAGVQDRGIWLPEAIMLGLVPEHAKTPVEAPNAILSEAIQLTGTLNLSDPTPDPPEPSYRDESEPAEPSEFELS